MIPRMKTNNTRDTFLVVMPALNEEAYIENNINSWASVVNEFPGSEILVVEGGSDDGTKVKLNKLARVHDFISIVDQEGKGHGNAIMQGYKIAIDSEHPWVFQADADGHFLPSDLYKLWKRKNLSNFILGYRHKRKDPIYRIALSKLISIWIFILFRKYIKDPNIPFRLVKRSYLQKALKVVPEGIFAPNIFLSILAKKNGHNLHHIPVKHSPRRDGKRNHFKLLKGAFKGFFELILFSLAVIQ